MRLNPQVGREELNISLEFWILRELPKRLILILLDSGCWCRTGILWMPGSPWEQQKAGQLAAENQRTCSATDRHQREQEITISWERSQPGLLIKKLHMQAQRSPVPYKTASWNLWLPSQGNWCLPPLQSRYVQSKSDTYFFKCADSNTKLQDTQRKREAWPLQRTR